MPVHKPSQRYDSLLEWITENKKRGGLQKPEGTEWIQSFPSIFHIFIYNSYKMQQVYHKFQVHSVCGGGIPDPKGTYIL